ncbi:hypothetical protein KJS94_12655 [Flavihumibacter rivuli]|uniref:hypothetical protein n=1 Tax=Flavihumibacter rivuli TaxID=2838156 RepID=UPI001BDE449D|nr:hypothetical protein [Flavihumibacter rivuli]ULQ55494.1 hypothetical protein KJS94_12655 [Flavihumibacter rivuli]
MPKTILLLLSALSFFPCLAQTKGLPASYQLVQDVKGDLDKDGIEELVEVYNTKPLQPGNVQDGIDRELIIFKRQGNDWVIWQRSSQAVYKSNEGGMMGDPFEAVDISNGILLIAHNGGSSWKWGHTDKYRFQNGRFELIGYTSLYGKDCEQWSRFDYNISTGIINFYKDMDECDENGEPKKVNSTLSERFTHKLKQPITLQERRKEQVKIITPKNKEELYL